MFLSEAHLVGMLQHPHILPIYDAGEEDGNCYIVTEHVHGARTLAAYCRADNLLRIDDVVEIMYKCAKALNYAHSRGVIHRDIKPSNIMLTQDSDVRIIDFGIALVADSDISSIEGIAGSPSYMSPEQVQSLELTNRSDLYSLGAVMYELLSGTRPFRAGNLQKLLHQIVYATPPPLHTLRRDIPEELESVVAMALQKDPAKRYKSGLDFAAELTRVHQRLRQQNSRIDRQEQFGVLRRLKFFHEFSHAEIWEVLRASNWQDYPPGEEIVKEGEMDDRFYIIVSGQCSVERHRASMGGLGTGDCFGEASYVEGSKRTATIRAASAVTVLKVSSTLLEQVSASCQLRFNRVFLRTLIARLQGSEARAELN
jgi:serine/threonine protein kinase